MSLPTGNPVWPPEETERAQALYDTWGAWYSGDPAQLSQVYGGGLSGTAGADFYEDPGKGTIIGRAIARVVRYFWGQRTNPRQAPSRVHVPLAADICEGSAQLLFEELPSITVETGQQRLDEIIDQARLHPVLLEAAELCAAYGGVYLRVGYDTDIAGVPLVDAIAPDTAVPEFRHNRLTAVTFWRVVHTGHGLVWRHLERHERGRILHGLYVGSRDRLGRPVPLTDQDATAYLADEVDADSSIATGHDGLTAVYVANVRPNRMMRGSPLGRSDLDGVDQLLDQLDEVWSSLGREHRLAAARAVIPSFMLRDLGAGNGAQFDDLQEFFTGVNIPPADGATTGQMIEFIQPEIRVEEHLRTCGELATQVIRGAGYSAATFDETVEGGGAVTATEIHARRRRTLQTQARKIGYWRPELVDLVEALLAVDRTVFPDAGAVVERPTVEWPDAVTDPEALGRTLLALFNAEATSTRTRVRMLHPDWTDEAVDAEVVRIHHDRPTEADPWADGAAVAGNLLGQGADEPPAEDPPAAPAEDADPAE